MNGPERRRHPRFPVNVPIRIVDAGREHTARLCDICRDAALVECMESWPLDTELELKMGLPGVNEVIEARGRVIRVATSDQGAPAMALLFTDLTPLAGMRIDFFISLQTDLGTGR